jgi:SAM-dependent methyltransferase
MSTNEPSLDWQGYVSREYRFSGFGRNAVVLDLGCGDGAQLTELREDGERPIGIDPYWPSLAACRMRGSTVVQGRAEEIPLRDGSVGGIVCKGVIPYTDEQRAFHEIRRVLKTGGIGHCAYLGAGYYLRYLTYGPTLKFRFYGARALINTWIYALTGRRLPGFLGDTVYQSHRRLERHYRASSLAVIDESPSKSFLGFPVFIYQSIRKLC